MLREQYEYWQHQMRTETSMFRNFAMRHLRVNSSTAECGHPDDTERIRAQIQAEGGSFELLDSVIFDWRKDMVQRLLQTAPPAPPQADIPDPTKDDAFFRYHMDTLQAIPRGV